MTTTDPLTDHERGAAHHRTVGEGPHFPNGHGLLDTHAARAVGDPTPGPTTDATFTSERPSARDQSGGDQSGTDTQACRVVAHTPPERASGGSTSTNAAPASGGTRRPPAPAMVTPAPNVPAPVLADPFLDLAADVLDDIERVRIANENRLRQLTRTGADKDGQERGFGLSLDHPAVTQLAAVVASFLCSSPVLADIGWTPAGRGEACCLEHDAEKNLRRRLRQHPLGPWIRAAKGIGEKQGARLLAAIGDPYIRPELTRKDGTVEPSRPRQVYELYAFCGYHVVPAGHGHYDVHTILAGGVPASTRQTRADAHRHSVGGTQPPTGQGTCDAHHDAVGGGHTGSDPDHSLPGTPAPSVGVAAARSRNTRMNWSPDARSRARMVSESIIKQLRKPCAVDPELGWAIHGDNCQCAPYRVLYDQSREKYADAIHKTPCKRCGPSGNPAPAGSVLSDGHKHSRALRLVSKKVLKHLWREARRLHKDAS